MFLEATNIQIISSNMQLKMTCGLFSFITIWAVQLMSHSAAAESPPATAESPSALTCNVTHQPDGSVLYQLSRPPTSSDCQTCWEDKNKTVIARNSDYDEKQVQNLTIQSVILKDCSDYLHHTTNCLGAWEEAVCKINCSLLDVKTPSPTPDSTLQIASGRIWGSFVQSVVTMRTLPPVNSTLICITESWCLPLLNFGLYVTGIILLVVVVLVVLLRRTICKCIRGESAAMSTSYTLASGRIIMAQEETVVVDIKTL